VLREAPGRIADTKEGGASRRFDLPDVTDVIAEREKPLQTASEVDLPAFL